MSVIAILIGFSIVVAGGFLAAFLWAVRSGQYDDKYTPSVRILFEDTQVSKQSPPEENKPA
jgi:cbb3-type cytochrome oxidase maturation protein